jgi:hypothetical protein
LAVKTDLTGIVRMAGETDTGIRVEIHLDSESLSLASKHGVLGTWSLSNVGVSAQPDGFHIKVEGEEILLSTNDDARFAIAIGLRSSSSPRLNRLLAHARDDGKDVAGVLAPAPPEIRRIPVEAPPPDLSRTPVALGFLGAAFCLFLAGIVAATNGSSLLVFGLVSVWPVWIVSGVTLGMGGFALLNGMRHGRNLVGVGALIGLLAVSGSLLSVTTSGFSFLSDGVVLGGTGTVLAGLLLTVDMLNRGE